MTDHKKPTVKRIVINKSGPFPQAVKLAYQTAVAEATDNGSTRITLLVPVKKQFEVTVTGEFLGRPFASKLAKEGSLPFTPELTIDLYSLDTISKAYDVEELLAVYVSPAAVESAIQQFHSLKTIIYLPWMPDELTMWRGYKNPTVIDVPDEPKA
ncbi:MAG: hypothetical protein WCF18_09025 [Chthoniobacteraceae bacterium]